MNPLEHFITTWNIPGPSGTFQEHIKHFMTTWNIPWPPGTFQDHLEHRKYFKFKYFNQIQYNFLAILFVNQFFQIKENNAYSLDWIKPMVLNWFQLNIINSIEVPIIVCIFFWPAFTVIAKEQKAGVTGASLASIVPCLLRKTIAKELSNLHFQSTFLILNVYFRQLKSWRHVSDNLLINLT